MLRIDKFRFGDGNYFWIQDALPRMLMHPIKPEMNGKDLGDTRDVDGVYYFKRWPILQSQWVRASSISLAEAGQ